MSWSRTESSTAGPNCRLHHCKQAHKHALFHRNCKRKTGQPDMWNCCGQHRHTEWPFWFFPGFTKGKSRNSLSDELQRGAQRCQHQSNYSSKVCLRSNTAILQLAGKLYFYLIWFHKLYLMQFFYREHSAFQHRFSMRTNWRIWSARTSRPYRRKLWQTSHTTFEKEILFCLLSLEAQMSNRFRFIFRLIDSFLPQKKLRVWLYFIFFKSDFLQPRNVLQCFELK